MPIDPRMMALQLSGLPTVMAGGPTGSVAPVQLTPSLQRGLQLQLKNALDYGGDKDLERVVRNAAKFGIDWSHLLSGR